MQDQDPWTYLPQNDKTTIANRLHIYAPSRIRLLAKNDEEALQWAVWQPGVLHPFGSLPGETDTYMAGLAQGHWVFVLVPTPLIQARRQAWLYQLVSQQLKTNDFMAIRASAENLQREILADPTPRIHLAFEADTLARQIEYWVSLLRDRSLTP